MAWTSRPVPLQDAQEEWPSPVPWQTRQGGPTASQNLHFCIPRGGFVGTFGMASSSSTPGLLSCPSAGRGNHGTDDDSSLGRGRPCDAEPFEPVEQHLEAELVTLPPGSNADAYVSRVAAAQPELLGSAGGGNDIPAPVYEVFTTWELLAIPLAGVSVALAAALIPARWAGTANRREIVRAVVQDSYGPRAATR